MRCRRHAQQQNSTIIIVIDLAKPKDTGQSKEVKMTKDMKKKDIKSSDTEECDDDCQYIFPQRLMSILSDEKNADAICWLPHGKAFIIRDRALFAEKVMPRFFSRKSKYSSFTRKLNRW